ncbi:Cardiolipin synthetase [Pteropus alecto]|uniref:Cardiolipin synthase (CMP-forming) n=2 Tax=Pteropus TaxID=9401 RepID=L5K0H1_PTEAL|nr:Cardiolipin synthetase [Pteropus alecto]
MLASRVARGSWGALRGAAWALRARRGKESALGPLLSPAPWCLGFLAERWWLRPAALGLQLPGAFSRGRCSGAGKATPGPTAGGGAAAEARGGRWGPASAASLYENPWTIPNMLSMTRIGLAPVLGYLIIEEDFNIALGVFALAGLTDLYENPWTIPNMLSMTRIGLAPVLGYLIIEEDFNIALGVFALAGLTDLLDGFIARNWANQKSALGSALDPLADKILISILYVSLTYADLIPVPLTYMIISRDIMLIAAVFYVRYRTLPTPRTLSKYFNPCYATARLKPTFISKVNTAVQLILVAASLAAPVFNYADSIYLQILWCCTGFTTAASAYSYYHYGRKTVQVIKGR